MDNAGRTNGGRDNRVVVVNDLFERANGHRRAPQLVHLLAFLLVALLLRLEPFLVLDELSTARRRFG